MEEAAETAPADPSAVPIEVYQRRLEKTKTTVETLHKEKAEMEKQVAELKEAEKKRKDE
jgi:translation initiation factor 1 (eIF-1/SUI1)